MPATLQALAGLDRPTEFAVELLVIDNASTDATAAVAERTLAALKPFFSYQVLYEVRPGKSRALELGFAKARYRYVCIVDDDNLLAPSYLNLAWEIMEADPAIGVLGGAGEPLCEVMPPAWFPQFAIDYAAAPQAPCSGDVTQTNRFLYGAGMVLRKPAWDKMVSQGFVSLVTEVRGSKPSGEDNEMCYALIFDGYKIWYDARLRFRHVISAQRLTWQFLCKTYRANATSHVELRPWVHFLEVGAQQPSRVPPLMWLRNGIYMLRYMFAFLGRALRRGELGKEGSADSIRVFYYWQSFKACMQKELQRDRSFYQVQKFIACLHHPLSNKSK
ncbi:glycosyltransferase [Hymenobacter sp. PAMC 26628]|uniref:glycosyltransferase n=1 Tax=Hymenobacter sp. PAMC 26628 TaxID=1484118 RepID=UPI00076FF9E6|nr:glycosyltransferase [Hymenobacter sp. PAMC 26628]AMJ64768.1 hypothetical protein AXW84_04465 [Hymenobacter sp. PAMC 26628]